MSKRASSVLLVVFLVFFLMLLVVACGSAASSGGEESGDGEALLQDRCTACHSLDRVTRAHKSSEEWQQNVTRMVNKGAKLSEDEQAVLVQYLTETNGP
jgi:hypothetical protein